MACCSAHADNLVAEQNHKTAKLAYKSRKEVTRERALISERRRILGDEHGKGVWTLDEYTAKLHELEEEDQELKQYNKQ